MIRLCANLDGLHFLFYWNPVSNLLVETFRTDSSCRVLYAFVPVMGMHLVLNIVMVIIIIIIITMTQLPYMGSGLLLPPLFEVTKSCAHSWQLVTGQLAALLFCRFWCVRQETWVRNGGFEFSLRNISIHVPCRISTTWDRRLYFPFEGSGATDFYHP
jgi:hypothetical protein